MPTFSRDLPPNPRGNALPIRRTPATHPLDAIVTSDDIIGCMTHWYHGSTVPCEELECNACQEGIPYRWHSYLTAAENRTNFHFLFEMTRLGAEPFVAYRKLYGTIRGCLFRAERYQRRHNGRIIVQTKPASLEDRVLPAPPDLVKVLAILWGLPADSVRTPDHHPTTHQPHVHANTPKDEFQCQPSSSPTPLRDALAAATQHVTTLPANDAPASAKAETTEKDSTSPGATPRKRPTNSRPHRTATSPPETD